MDDPTKQQSLNKQAKEFIATHKAAVLSTVDSGGIPNSAVVYYVPDENWTVYFVTKSGTRKYNNIKQNLNVSLCIFDEVARKTIQAEGIASEPESMDEQVKVLDELAKMKLYQGKPWFPPIAKLQEGRFAVIKVELNSVRYGDFTVGRSTETFDYLEKVY